MRMRVALLWAMIAMVCLLLGIVAPAPRGETSAEAGADDPPYVPPKGYVCYRASGPITIDGQLDEIAWQQVPWTDPFVDIEGDTKPRPRFRTRVKMLWDDQFFYVAAELEEPHVWGTLTQHDAVIFQDNDFEVFIDPNGDNHEYYEFEINAFNTCYEVFFIWNDAYEKGGFEGWMVEDGKITEGTSSNAYIVKDGKVITRPLSTSILAGVTRRSLFRLARERGVAIDERTFTPEEAYVADEAFLTSATNFVLPIVEIDGRRIGGGQPGPVVRKLREIYLEEALR